MTEPSFFDRIILFLAKLWKIDHTDKFCALNKDARNEFTLVMIAHGATKDRLTYGAEMVVGKTMWLFDYYTDFGNRIYFGAFDKEYNWEIERDDKRYAFPEAGFFGRVVNTINECLKFRELFFSEYKHDPEKIVVVTDEAHSRRCRIVWKTFFPNSQIYILTVPIEDCVDIDSPMETYHKLWKILWNQAWPIVIFKPLSWFGEKGLMLLSGYHQPTTKSAS